MKDHKGGGITGKGGGRIKVSTLKSRSEELKFVTSRLFKKSLRDFLKVAGATNFLKVEWLFPARGAFVPALRAESRALGDSRPWRWYKNFCNFAKLHFLC